MLTLIRIVTYVRRSFGAQSTISCGSFDDVHQIREPIDGSVWRAHKQEHSYNVGTTRILAAEEFPFLNRLEYGLEILECVRASSSNLLR